MGTRGPIGDPNSRRRRNTVHADIQLPSAGRPGPAPEWPIGVTSRKPTKALLSIWEDLWRRPQAVAWQKLALDLTVARYARMLQMSMDPDATKKFAGEVRQLEDRLGLSGPALQRLGWEIVDQVAEGGEGAGESAGVTDLGAYREQYGA